MGVCETDELDSLSGVPIVDIMDAPQHCPKCDKELDDDDYIENECQDCGLKLSSED